MKRGELVDLTSGTRHTFASSDGYDLLIAAYFTSWERSARLS